MSMKVSIENGKICNETKLRNGLERFVEVWIVDQADGFGFDFVEEKERALPQAWEQYSKKGQT